MIASAAPDQLSYFLREQQHRWWRWFALSMVLHVLVFGAAWYKATHMSDSDLVHKSAIMVETVAWAPEVRPKHWMPRMAPTPEPEPEKKQALKLTPNTEEKPEKKPDDEEKKKKEREKKEAERAKQRKLAMQRALKKVKNDYNSWDGSPDGVKGALSAEAKQVLGSLYATQLRDVFRENFTVPEVIPTREYEKLKAKILIKIDRSGQIIDTKLVEGSGNQIFDSAALKAVKLTQKVPLPDEMLRDLVIKEGIIINFYWKE